MRAHLSAARSRPEPSAASSRLTVAIAIAFAVLLGGLEWGRRQRVAPALLVPAPLEAQPADFYRVRWGGVALDDVPRAGGVGYARLTMTNAGTGLWADPALAGRSGMVRVAYRWWSGDGATLVSGYDNRTEIPWPVRGGESVSMPLAVRLPPLPGNYRLQVDLVQELVAWFGNRGADQLVVPVTVEPAP